MRLRLEAFCLTVFFSFLYLARLPFPPLLLLLRPPPRNPRPLPHCKILCFVFAVEGTVWFLLDRLRFVKYPRCCFLAVLWTHSLLIVPVARFFVGLVAWALLLSSSAFLFFFEEAGAVVPVVAQV